MLVYGINYSEQIENNKEKLTATFGITGGMAAGSWIGLGVAGVTSSLVFAGPTFGLSLIWGAASAGLSGAGSVGAVAASYDLSEVNNGKGSTINLKNEIRDTDSSILLATGIFFWVKSKSEPESLETLTIQPTQKHTSTVIFLHGLGGNAAKRKDKTEGNRNDIMNLKQDKKGLLKSVKQIEKIIREEINSGISPQKIMVMGHSQGGSVALAVAIGDIFGKTGREIIKNYLPQLKKEEKIDLVVANVENTTHGKGISYKHYLELEKYGIDIMTSGNHIFNLEETQKNFAKFEKLIRPFNSNPYHPGKGTTTKEVNNKKIRITNLLGTTFMPMAAENPYYALEKILKGSEFEKSDIHLVDFHAETTAEKNALALCYDGKISALWGTHTHVQTADERILDYGTAFITDLGMTGPAKGVIGAEPKAIIKRAKEGLPAKMEPHEDKEDKGQFNGIIIEFDDVMSEAINFNLELKHPEPEYSELYLLRGKRGKDRYVYISPEIPSKGNNRDIKTPSFPPYEEQDECPYNEKSMTGTLSDDGYNSMRWRMDEYDLWLLNYHRN
nr:12344_t:CDS:2 [Entrophospora candida]